MSSMGIIGVLVDLDGPLTRLLPAPAHLELAAHLAAEVPELGDANAFADHVHVLRRAAAARSARLPDLLARASAAELEAAGRAEPAPGAADFLTRVRDAGLPVAVVSNNADAAVHRALRTCGLNHLVDHVVARLDDELDRLKPAPDLVLEAAVLLGLPPQKCVLHGDSVTDVEAALHAGARAVGVSSEPGRAAELRRAGAQHVVPDLGLAPVPRALPTMASPVAR